MVLALTLPRVFILLKLVLPVIGGYLRRLRALFSHSKYLGPSSINPQPRPDFSDNDVLQIDDTPTRPDPVQLSDLDQGGRRVDAGVHESITNANSFGDAVRRLVHHHLAMSRVQLPAAADQSLWAKMWSNMQDDFWAFAWISTLAFDS